MPEEPENVWCGQDGQMFCGVCEVWKWPDYMWTDNDGNYTEVCIECVEKH